MNQRFEDAAVAIFVAMVLDGLDGRVARLTKTQSAFGAEFDSLSDMVSFGAAPALVMYEWALRPMDKLGWVAAFVYCAARRSGWRASTPTSTSSTSAFFQGIAEPGGGGAGRLVSSGSRMRST
jgi:CDP-diacylglycerol--serine O-phosphatidyltransferase